MNNCLSFLIGITLSSILILSCYSSSSPIEKKVQAYYTNYQVRSNFDEFMGHYADSIRFEDIINGDRIAGRTAVRAFFQWDNSEFKLLDTVAFIIEDQVIDQNKSITKGYFTPFEWGGKTYESMYFTSILHFNGEQKIVKQIDWINYPNNLVDYESRRNSNEWIK